MKILKIFRFILVLSLINILIFLSSYSLHIYIFTININIKIIVYIKNHLGNIFYFVVAYISRILCLCPIAVFIPYFSRSSYFLYKLFKIHTSLFCLNFYFFVNLIFSNDYFYKFIFII